MVFAWPTAEIAVMGAEGAANIISPQGDHRGGRSRTPSARRRSRSTESLSPTRTAAARGYVDAVIVPSETRPRLIDALETMCGKRELRPPKKHGNIPM